jgi:aspartyl-tRNA(Asn)/glutamyl-tRNA(Gln) amidotransferase subunit C
MFFILLSELLMEMRMSGDSAQQADIDVRRVAHLARLSLTDAEAEAFQQQLQAIVGYVHKIGELDLSEVEPTSHVYPMNNVFRKDEPLPGLDRDDILANAPRTEKDQFIVPKIVE